MNAHKLTKNAVPGRRRLLRGPWRRPLKSSSPRAGTVPPRWPWCLLAVPCTADEPDPMASVDLAGIVAFDLTRSGQFSLLPSDNMLSYPSAPDQVYLPRLAHPRHGLPGHRTRVDGSVRGGLGRLPPVRCDFGTRDRLVADHGGSAEKLRDIAHRISDEVYEHITGIRGAFSTKLLYVLVEDAATNERRPTI